MVNHNGQILLDVLNALEEPTSLQGIVSIVAESSRVKKEQIYKIVKRTLCGGVRYGYVQYANRKYFHSPVPELHADLLDEKRSEDSVNAEDQLSDGSPTYRRLPAKRRLPKRVLH